jgi:hypothetical protein
LPASRGVVANRWEFRRSSKANPWRFCGLNWSLRSSESAWLGWRVTACLAGSHEIETFSGEKVYLRRGFPIILDFLARTFSAVIASLPTSRLLARFRAWRSTSYSVCNRIGFIPTGTVPLMEYLVPVRSLYLEYIAGTDC